MSMLSKCPVTFFRRSGYKVNTDKTVEVDVRLIFVISTTKPKPFRFLSTLTSVLLPHTNLKLEGCLLSAGLGCLVVKL